MKLKDLLKLFDNWNAKLRINDYAEAKPIVEYNYVYELAFHDEYADKKHEYLLECPVMAFGYYEDTLCVRVDEREREVK